MALKQTLVIRDRLARVDSSYVNSRFPLFENIRFRFVTPLDRSATIVKGKNARIEQVDRFRYSFSLLFYLLRSVTYDGLCSCSW